MANSIGDILILSSSEGKQSFTLTIPKNYEVPQILYQLVPSDLALVLDLAVKAYSFLSQSSNQVSYKEALEKEVAEIRDEQERAVKAVTSQYKASMLEREGEVEQLKLELSLAKANNLCLKEDVHEQVKTELARAKELLDQTRDECLRLMEDRYKKEAEKDRERLDQEWQRVRQLQEQLNEKVSRSSVARGRQGETEFVDLIAMHTTWKVTDTSKVPHSADICVAIGNCQARIEVKNYKNTVPKTEVDKFYRDMSEHPETPFGIFVSMKTSIAVNLPGDVIKIGWTDQHHQMVAFVPNFSDYDPKVLLCIFESLARVADKAYNVDSNSKSDEALNYELKCIQLSTLITDQLKALRAFEQKIHHDKKSQLALIAQQFSAYKQCVDVCIAALQSAIHIVSGEKVCNGEGRSLAFKSHVTNGEGRSPTPSHVINGEWRSPTPRSSLSNGEERTTPSHSRSLLPRSVENQDLNLHGTKRPCLEEVDLVDQLLE